MSWMSFIRLSCVYLLSLKISLLCVHVCKMCVCGGGAMLSMWKWEDIFLKLVLFHFYMGPRNGAQISKTFPRLAIWDTLLSSLGKCLLSVRERRLRLDLWYRDSLFLPSNLLPSGSQAGSALTRLLFRHSESNVLANLLFVRRSAATTGNRPKFVSPCAGPAGRGARGWTCLRWGLAAAVLLWLERMHGSPVVAAEDVQPVHTPQLMPCHMSCTHVYI